MDVDLELTAPDPIKNVARAFLEFLARRRVRAEIHPGEVETALGTEQARVDRCDRAASLPIDHHGATRTQAVQALGEGRLTNTVVDHVDTAPIRKSLHLLGEVDLGVENRLAGAGLPRRLGLSLGGDCPNDPCAALFGNLTQQQADAASGCM